MLSIKEGKSKKLEGALEERLAKDLETVNEEDLFVLATYDETASEKTGYSNYSYWRSTLQVFFKNKVAVFLLFVLAALLLFTFVQPYLPGQYPANQINNNPQTGKQLSNLSPSMTTVLTTAPQGTLLNAEPVKDAEGWYAVDNVLDTLKARTKFTLVEYGEEWCRVEYKDMTGYVKNNFQTKLKLPDDPAATPYESRSNFKLELYMQPQDYTNNGTALYVQEGELELLDDGTATTRADAELRVLPSEHAFWFGTNNIGQDLWARVWSGTRTSLLIGFIVALVEAVVGITVGVLWGYVRRLDRILTEIYNVVDNIPNTIILILISYIMRPGFSTLVFAMSLTCWLGMARFIRNQIVIIRDRDYNLASRCLGTGTVRIIVRNLLPYLVSVIMLRLALSIPSAIGNEVFITYIGLGLPVDMPSLGNLINEGRKLVTSETLRYQLIFPAIVLSVVTISFYIIGNAFADAADPKNHMYKS
ncbi:MAG: ABC transporter permease [Christensenellales bacterium]|nr:ABC transporter permease [Christensenellales bacterium]